MIKYILLALIVIIVLSFFGYDLKAIIEAPQTQANLEYTKDGVVTVWDKYLSKPFDYLWNDVFVGIIWQAFLNNLGRISAGAPTELENAGKRLINIGDQGYRPIGE